MIINMKIIHSTGILVFIFFFSLWTMFLLVYLDLKGKLERKILKLWRVFDFSLLFQFDYASLPYSRKRDQFFISLRLLDSFLIPSSGVRKELVQFLRSSNSYFSTCSSHWLILARSQNQLVNPKKTLSVILRFSVSSGYITFSVFKIVT